MAGLALESQQRAAVPGPHGDWLYTFARSDPSQSAGLKVRMTEHPLHFSVSCDPLSYRQAMPLSNAASGHIKVLAERRRTAGCVCAAGR